MITRFFTSDDVAGSGKKGEVFEMICRKSILLFFVALLQGILGMSLAEAGLFQEFCLLGQAPQAARPASTVSLPLAASPQAPTGSYSMQIVYPYGDTASNASPGISSSVARNQPHYPGFPTMGSMNEQRLPPIELDPSCDPGCGFPDYTRWNENAKQAWTWQMFPRGRIWSAYLAGVKESRMGGVWNKDDHLGWIWDITLGGRAGILRYGNRNPILPSGIQLDIEGAAMTRLALDKDRDLEATDYRFGLPLTFGNERWQFKVSYYHVSCHLGDEYMIRMDKLGLPYERLNYYRDSLVFGLSFRPQRDLRFYGEIEYAVYSGELTDRWQTQFGIEYAPLYPANGWRGAPFFAINGLLLEELDFGGSVNVQAGWAWRGERNQMFRLGLQYFYGADDQYEFYRDTNNKFGFGLWYEF